MSRETMRAELAAALAEVGVGVGLPDNLPAETLVRAATAWMTSASVSLRSVERREGEWRVQVRAALQRAGRDPGSHASLDDMIAELVAVADGRLVR